MSGRVSVGVCGMFFYCMLKCVFVHFTCHPRGHNRSIAFLMLDVCVRCTYLNIFCTHYAPLFRHRKCDGAPLNIYCKLADQHPETCTSHCSVLSSLMKFGQLQRHHI